MAKTIAEIEAAAARLRGASPAEVIAWGLESFGREADHRLQLLGRGLRDHRHGAQGGAGAPRRRARLRPRYRPPPRRDLPDRRAGADEVRRRRRLVLPAPRSGRDAAPDQGALQLPGFVGQPPRVLRHPQGRAAGPGADRRRGLDDRAAQRAVRDPHRHARGRDRRRPRRHRQAEPPRALDDGAGSRIREGAPRSRPPHARPRLSVDRLRPLHPRHLRPASTRARAAGGGRIPRTRSAGSTCRYCRAPERFPRW